MQSNQTQTAQVSAYSGNFFKDLWVLVLTLVKWAIFTFFTVLSGIVAVIFGIFRLANAAHAVARLWGRTLVFFSGVRVQVHNPEKLYRDGPVIVMANHQSLFDVLVMYSALDIQFRWLAKASVFKIPFLGWGMSGAGYIPVERDDKKKALQALFVAAEKVQAGKSVIIYPEGTRGYPDGTMRSFKKGGFILAKKAGAVIQPLTIDGARRILPVQKGHWIQRMYGGTMDVYIHDPLLPESFAGKSVDELAVALREIIQKPLPVKGKDTAREAASAGVS